MGAAEQVVSAARQAYDADPTPLQMQRILGSMILDMAAVYQQAAGVEAGNPLADEWIEDFRNFQYRIYDYQQIVNAFVNPGEYPASAAAKHHYIPVSDLPKAYNLLVVEPILKGNAASTIAPESRPYSKVGRTPDVATAVVLSKRLKPISDYANLSWTEQLILGNLYQAKRAGEGIVSQAATDLGEIARMEVEKEMPALMEKAKTSIMKHAFVGAKRATAAPIMLALGIGALALFGRKGK
jgi:hypothetical protein